MNASEDGGRREILVGLDGSDDALEALRWATARAAEHNRPIRLVHCWLWPRYGVPLGPVPGVEGSGLRNAADQVLATGKAQVLEQAPEVEVETELVTGRAADVLAQKSADAALLVIASRGLDGFSAMWVGSVGAHLTARAYGPVAVVRGERHADGPVVVGVDGSEDSKLALRTALQFAEQWKAPLVVLYAWRPPEMYGLDLPFVFDDEPMQKEARAVVSEAVAEACAHHPTVEVKEEFVVTRSPNAALTEASKTARLVVVGSRGKGAVKGMLLGSKSQALIRHAHCPVLISRPLLEQLEQTT